MTNLIHPDSFDDRHIGPNDKEIEQMLNVVNAKSLNELMEQTIPSDIILKHDIELQEPLTEYELLEELEAIAANNKVYKSYIGMGYYNTYTPPVIQRNIFENPGWYTQYTPYQAEISQGRLEALLNFQTMIIDLTGLPVANASLLDEGTSAAEAMHLLYAAKPSAKKNSNKFFVDINCFPQTLDILKTRSIPSGIDLVIDNIDNFDYSTDYFGILVQYPDNNGEVKDFTDIFSKAKSNKINCIIAADIMSLALLKTPAEMGADIAVGSTQRFGVPMGYGGPHAAYFACKDEYRRLIPGRIIGVSVDSQNDKAYRMALQTREQHIRREKATSNICTAQVLLAIMAGMYAVYHGPKRIKDIAKRIHKLTVILESSLKKLGYKQLNKLYFDTLKIEANNSDNIRKKFEINKINLRYFDDKYIGISLDETSTIKDVESLISLFADISGKSDKVAGLTLNGVDDSYPESFNRRSEFMTHPVFHIHQSETKMLRYIKTLENKDLSLTLSMIPLGSCTMKLNASAEMYPVSWPEFSSLHPFIPLEQAEGYQEIFRRIEKQLSVITEFPAVSLQPNSGAQGEFTGLMVIRAYHIDKGEGHRKIVLIPASAHGTNPASAVMAGMNVVVVKTTDKGEIDIDDLKIKAEKYKNELAAIMVTYPSTHGVFEDRIIEICEIIHNNGGQVYMDGANLNAQVGLTSPKAIGADVCHINLHKTFCIPHGGGGPGMGPIAVAEHLAPFLPSHPVIKLNDKGINAVSAAPWGSANILLISYAYIRMMGLEGLKKATKVAILNANYLKVRLEHHFPVLYTGSKGRVAHELIFDVRGFKHDYDVDVDDIAKRLMDYGFHAPTVSFPVPGTLMVEPTESESLYELDRFCTSMELIYNEIMEIADGKADKKDNVLKNAPHNSKMISSDNWVHPYSREKAAFPAQWLLDYKFWPASGRIDNAYGDRNFMCSCIPVSSYEALYEEEKDKVIG